MHTRFFLINRSQHAMQNHFFQCERFAYATHTAFFHIGNMPYAPGTAIPFCPGLKNPMDLRSIFGRGLENPADFQFIFIRGIENPADFWFVFIREIKNRIGINFIRPLMWPFVRRMLLRSYTGDLKNGDFSIRSTTAVAVCGAYAIRLYTDRRKPGWFLVRISGGGGKGGRAWVVRKVG